MWKLFLFRIFVSTKDFEKPNISPEIVLCHKEEKKRFRFSLPKSEFKQNCSFNFQCLIQFQFTERHLHRRFFSKSASSKPARFLTHIKPLGSFYNPWKYQNCMIIRTEYRQIRSIERDKWHEMSQRHCEKSVRIGSFSGPYFTAFRLNTDQKNSEYGHFSCSEKDSRTGVFLEILWNICK